MRNWHLGQKVVCVNNTPNIYKSKWPESFPLPIKKGNIYVIREIIKIPNFDTLGLRLEGINIICQLTKQEYNWDHRRFRPLEPDISVFENLLKNINSKEKELEFIK